MKRIGACSAVLLSLLFTSACSHLDAAKSGASATQPSATSKSPSVTIGGEPVVVLSRPRSADATHAQLIEATLLPGRGMNLLQLKAYVPGKGEVDLIASPGLAEAKQYLDVKDDEFGTNTFRTGSALLYPWANRITGPTAADGKNITATVQGKQYPLPANFSGSKPGAPKTSIHGLTLQSKFEGVEQSSDASASTMKGVLHGGNFGGRWPSQSDLQVETVLKNDALEMTVIAKNVGQDPLPVAIGAHPYFRIASGDRKQVRLHVPATKRTLVNNSDDMFPTGKLADVKGTAYDFTDAKGKALGDFFVDDNFSGLQRNSDGNAAVEMIDPAAGYGVRVTALSPEIKAFQVYAPLEKSVVAIEPQFNLNDPFSKVWGKTDTGVIVLQPGQSVSWRMRLEVFVPQQ